jgi:hypothetical protein
VVGGLLAAVGGLVIGGLVVRREMDDIPRDRPTTSTTRLPASVGAPGDEASSNEEADYVDAITEIVRQDRLSDEEDGCIARTFVEAVGLDDLREWTPDGIRSQSGIAQLDLTIDEQERNAFGEGLRACIDIRALFLASAANEGPDVVECIDQNVDDELLELFVVTVAIDGESGAARDPALVSGMGALFSRCGLPTP